MAHRKNPNGAGITIEDWQAAMADAAQDTADKVPPGALTMDDLVDALGICENTLRRRFQTLKAEGKAKSVNLRVMTAAGIRQKTFWMLIK